MSLYNKTIYNILKYTRNKNSLKIINCIGNIDDYNLILPNLYLGNINCANDKNFLEENNIGAVVNCTEDEPFSDYFDDKPKIRILINDSKDKENIDKFRCEIIDCLLFIDSCIKNNKIVYVHCYWGLMRSATVVASYLIKKCNISHLEAINFVREQRPLSLSSLYNFNEILIYVENYYKR
jgi:hypothetical protein